MFRLLLYLMGLLGCGIHQPMAQIFSPRHAECEGLLRLMHGLRPLAFEIALGCTRPSLNNFKIHTNPHATIRQPFFGHTCEHPADAR